MIPLHDAVLSAFLVFCRIGGCMMLMPGFAGHRMPVRIRLFLAVGISLAILPLLFADMAEFVQKSSRASLILAIATELATGGIIGFLARVFFLMLQTMLVAMAQFIGLSMVMGPADDDEQLPPIATLLALTATTMMFITDQHYELLRGIIASYRQIPIGVGFGGRGALMQVTDQMSAALMLGMRLASPFLVYSLIMNFAIGLINKMTPQIPVFFIATPFLMAGGMLLLYALSDQLLVAFVSAFGVFLRLGSP
ncbi:flagellar biosynthesis protein FliR [Azorhizobium oxalatiphilum]|uniref:Flagellar biosynthesis protein FliR n=1 Tax=Azorhizobium oxalatiphilum TaxID=980631 RepID=A0A917BLB2_9HYPH|nr:flagellar biosynthesis protein FliR [Azorhizobium oxalatiphilum]GGF47950.1 flagellar biosynthesis protein FliR [Azorhizobium oxalatiphilum]